MGEGGADLGGADAETERSEPEFEQEELTEQLPGPVRVAEGVPAQSSDVVLGQAETGEDPQRR
ncbi:hypothetical protein AB0D59_08065 [Streptomyces sp. NPDC048417]|uniref:hypothetical protein n=1 Tax=Streptomyces sp. NPDC048417 TaxID=3155387 RepID=UPI00341D727B